VRVEWLQAALSNLEEQADFIAENNLEAAQKMLADVASAVSRLSHFPSLGRAGRVEGTRELVVPPYVIPYRVNKNAVEILRIFHGTQNWPNKL
jgi:toxin ParE1/3/4